MALIGFGLDSSVEVLAGVVVLWQLGGDSEEKEQRPCGKASKHGAAINAATDERRAMLP